MKTSIIAIISIICALMVNPTIAQGANRAAAVKAEAAIKKQKALLKQRLVRIDRALKMCLSQDEEIGAASDEQMKVMQLREKIFFTLMNLSSKTTKVSVYSLKRVAKEAETATGLGEQCQLQLDKVAKRNAAMATKVAQN